MFKKTKKFFEKVFHHKLELYFVTRTDSDRKATYNCT